MKRLVVTVAALALLFGTVGQTNAAFVSDNLAVMITPQLVDFPDFGGNDLPTLIVEKTFDNLDPIVATITYEAADLQPFGVRWFERITNNTGIAWIGYELAISGDTNATFLIEACCGGLPSEVTSDYALGVVTQIDLKTNKPTISADQKELSFDLRDNPIPHAGVLEIHVPIANLSSGTSFVLTQQDAPIPEPGTLLLIGSGLVGIGAGARRRNRRK